MTEKRRKLIFFWTYLEWGGAQIYFLAIIKEALRDWDIVVVLPRNSSPEMKRFIDQLGVRSEFLNFHLETAPAPSITGKLRRQFRRIRVEFASFRYLLRYDLRENILHIEFPPWQSWILFTMLALRRANVFVTMHNALPRSPAWRVRLWKLRLQFVSRLPGFHIFASNQDTKDQLRGWVAEQFWQNIEVTYTSVNPPEIENVVSTSNDFAAIRSQHGIEGSKFVVLCVGQFIDRKGRWVFLDAARKVNEANSDVSFVWLTPKIPGDDDLARIKAFCLGDNFRLVLSESVGSTREEILRFFRVADVFALASFVEGLPIALLEAMALGIPSVSTNINAIPEAIKHMETGLLIDAGDASALAESILLLKNDTELRRTLSVHGRDYVIQNFDERDAAKIALRSYRGSLASR